MLDLDATVAHGVIEFHPIFLGASRCNCSTPHFLVGFGCTNVHIGPWRKLIQFFVAKYFQSIANDMLKAGLEIWFPITTIYNYALFFSFRKRTHSILSNQQK